MILKICVFCILIFHCIAVPLPSFDINKDLLEGDMKLNPAQALALTGVNSQTGLLELIRRWPTSLEGFVTVPYRLDPAYSPEQVDWLLDQFRRIEEITCVRFVPRTYQIDWIFIVAQDGCWSYVGRQGGRQPVAMSPGCFYAGLGAHEMMHALGFGHMHNADDRDDYIDIKWENVDPENHSAFTKYYTGWFSNFNTIFDVRSSMNYDRRAYSNNGQDVIVPRDRKYLETIGMEQFSAGDGTRVNRMYKCRTH